MTENCPKTLCSPIERKHCPHNLQIIIKIQFVKVYLWKSSLRDGMTDTKLNLLNGLGFYNQKSWFFLFKFFSLSSEHGGGPCQGSLEKWLTHNNVFNNNVLRVPLVAKQVKDLTSSPWGCEFDPWPHSVGLGSGIASSCSVVCRFGLDPVLLWLWCRPAAAAQIRSLAQELP